MLARILGPSESESKGGADYPPHRMTQILMCHCWHLLIVVCQVVLKKTVTVHQTLRLCRQRVQVVYGD